MAASVLLLFSASLSANAGIITTNGSLEDLGGNFANTICNNSYMSLTAGSTAISGWTVAPATSGAIVWGNSPTCDGFNAAAGNFFVDLTGAGSNSPNGAIQQSLNLIGGALYSVSLDLASFNNGAVSVTVGAQLVSLSAGGSFVVGNTSWTDYTGSFIGDPADLSPLLKVALVSPGSTIVFLDNINVSGATASVPEPLSLSVFGAGLVGVITMRRRKKKTA